MRNSTTVLTLFCVLALLLVGVHPSRADEGLVLEPPVPGSAMRGFSAGPHPWSPGHRGVDLAAARAEPARAAATGVVHFAGTVAGRPSVSVDHGNGLRTTYTPVRASVSEGDVVAAGDVIGRVVAGHCATVCLHWGLTDGSEYFDPLAYLAVRPVRLLPEGTLVVASPEFGAARAGMASTDLPVAGRISSRFGMRTHPVTGVRKLHDGLDLAAACGTPVRLPWSGRVTTVQRHPAYGNRVVVQHAGGRSAYAHLSRMDVRQGQQLGAGAVVGAVGSTGLSTGCHLHWMTWRGGSLVDPLTLVDRFS
ncbi:hypothetical protein GCM10028820_32760 [Tessaracoccus terricola]